MASILLAEARFYPHLNDMLLAGARAAIEAAGHKHETLTVPGALELPGAIALAARSGRFCAFVALGVVIRGETYHFEIVSEESARALMELTIQGFAIGNGILTVENEAQAIERADPARGDKGGGAARAALALFELREQYAP
jgi:6,7-dimethyl-8-ribityllumazine synthase